MGGCRCMYVLAVTDFKMTRELQGDAYNGKTTVSEFHIFVARVAGVSHVSLDCHRDVARLSRSVTRCRRRVARCHRDVTAESHICHTLSQAVATTVIPITPCHRVSIHLSTCKQVDISSLRWGVSWSRQQRVHNRVPLPVWTGHP